jgi:hypothetical protein
MPTAYSPRPRTTHHAAAPADRCDRYRAVRPVSELLFCGHHACQRRTRPLTTGPTNTKDHGHDHHRPH